MSTQVTAILDEAIASLRKKASTSQTTPPEDPTEKGSVSVPMDPEATQKAATGVADSAAPSAKMDAPTEQTVGDSPVPAAKKEDSSITKAASDVLTALKELKPVPSGGQKKQAASETPEAPASPEDASRDIPDDPYYLLKVAHLVLGCERGRNLVSEIAIEDLGKEQAENMLATVFETHDNIVKQAAYDASEEAQQNAFREAILLDEGLTKEAKEEFLRGEVVHQQGIDHILSDLEKEVGGESLIKQASVEDREKLGELVEAVQAAYVHGAQLAKHAAAMAAEAGAGAEMTPEDLEALLVELDNYSPEEKLAAIQMLVEEGAIDEETAVMLVSELVPEAAGANAPVEEDVMAKTASVLAKFQDKK